MTFASPQEKRAYTRALFARIAPRYELVNAVMSLGQVGLWRRLAAAEALLPDQGRILDVAAGGGGLTRALVRRWPGSPVVAVDFAREMVAEGRRRRLHVGIHWTEGDALRLPFPDGTFDAVVSSFMMRNVTDVRAALAEQSRVVQPGGRVVCLEMTWPRSPLLRPLFRLYFSGLVPVLGWLLTGCLDAYRYLPRSVEVFLSPEELTDTMRRVGFSAVRYRRLSLGTVTLHVGVGG